MGFDDKVNEFAGKAQEAAGNLLNNEEWKAEGRERQGEAKAAELKDKAEGAVNDAKDKADDATDNIQDKANEFGDKTKGFVDGLGKDN